MRALAQRISTSQPDVLALSEIDDGDALALATRFDLQWAYRGGQALLWNARLRSARVAESYLPAAPLQAFERRGLLRLDGAFDDGELSLLAARFSSDRSRARDLRFTRGIVRAMRATGALLFITNSPPSASDAFRDFGFAASGAPAAPALLLATRGCDVRSCVGIGAGNGLGPQLLAGLTILS
jgi:hypothetical protein